MRVEEQQKQLFKTIEICCRRWIKNNGNLDYRVEGYINKVNGNNTFDVVINKEEYTEMPCRTGLESYLKEGSLIEVLLVNGDMSKSKIDDLLKWK